MEPGLGICRELMKAMKGHWPSHFHEKLEPVLAALKEAEKGLQEPRTLIGLNPSQAALLAKNVYQDYVMDGPLNRTALLLSLRLSSQRGERSMS